MSRLSNLKKLELAQEKLSLEQVRQLSDYLLGSLSVLVSDNVWDKALRHATELLSKVEENEHAQMD